MKNFKVFGKTGEGESSLRRRGTPMLWLVLPAVCLALTCVACAQVAPAGDAGGFMLSAGATGSGYTLPYGDRKLLGVSAFVDAETKRRLGVEAEARWLVFHQTGEVHAETYLIGPRYRYSFGRFQIYGKGLVGFAQFNFPYNYAHGNYLVIAPGGGVDYRLTNRIRLRVADFEYQYWPQFTFGTMTSAGVSTGIRIRIF